MLISFDASLAMSLCSSTRMFRLTSDNNETFGCISLVTLDQHFAGPDKPRYIHFTVVYFTCILHCLLSMLCNTIVAIHC